MNAAAAVRVTTPNDRDVVITREFSAPSRIVYDALTNPALLTRWYAMPGWTLDVCEVDLRVGGKWRFVMRKPNGKPVGQKGVYQELVPGERIVNTETWEDWDAGETLVTTVLTESAGHTVFSSTVRFPSREVRDTVLASGFDSGVQNLYTQLDSVLATLTAPSS
jgi:uncharacterized protein YndB with AHSA1/START domain